MSIHEENAGALVLAQTLPPQFTPQSKYYAAMNIWFHEQIVKRGIKLLKIDSNELLQDIFTKGLVKTFFGHPHRILMGWQIFSSMCSRGSVECDCKYHS